MGLPQALKAGYCIYPGDCAQSIKLGPKPEWMSPYTPPALGLPQALKAGYYIQATGSNQAGAQT